MGHLTSKNYFRLYKRMDCFVPGVYDSKTFYEILKVLFNDEEAALCSVMPLIPFSISRIAKIWQKTETEAEAILNNLSEKGLVYDFIDHSPHTFALATPVLGFFEFSLMRTDGKFDRKILSELYYQYINVEDGFAKKLSSIDPPISRTFVYETAIQDITSEVLSYEKASWVIDSADCISVGTCFCRHKMEHLGKACDNPQDVCLTFNDMAKSLVRHGIARKSSKAEAHKILDFCIKRGLAQIGENIKDKPVIICNCCGCCCDLLLTYKRLGASHIISPSSYWARIDENSCSQCGTCIKKCPVNAISLVKDRVIIDKKWCLGCGVCTRFCETNSCKMEPRPKKVFVPEDYLEKYTLGAIYEGKVGNFFFDSEVSLTLKFLRSLLNYFGKLPLIRNLLLNRKINSLLLKTFLKTKMHSNRQIS